MKVNRSAATVTLGIDDGSRVHADAVVLAPGLGVPGIGTRR